MNLNVPTILSFKAWSATEYTSWSTQYKSSTERKFSNAIYFRFTAFRFARSFIARHFLGHLTEFDVRLLSS